MQKIKRKKVIRTKMERNTDETGRPSTLFRRIQNVRQGKRGGSRTKTSGTFAYRKVLSVEKNREEGYIIVYHFSKV